MKAIMYHYVREHNEAFPHFKYLHVEDFEKQLDYFSDNFGFMSKSDFEHAIRTGETKHGVVLTFDDAFSDHYDYVYSVLRKRGMWGIFYVPTKPYSSGKILDVHRIHLLLGKVGGTKLLEMLDGLVNDDMLSHSSVQDFHNFTYSTQKGNAHKDTVMVKKILNYFVSYEFREGLLDILMDRVFDEQDALLRNFYLSKTQMTEMAKNGMIIGSHTVSHPVMSKLELERQAAEISESFAFLEQFIPVETFKTFCYPHGGFHTFSRETEALLTENGVRYSFNVEPRDVAAEDLLNRPQALPRYDCNLFPHGKVAV